jgi:soluble cytochrome b562
MSTQAVSSASIYQEIQGFYQNRQSDLQTLSSALQSGNLNAAQQSFQQLVSLGQSGPFSNAEPFNQANRASDFEAIGQALSAGNIAGAQTAFATLQQTFTQGNAASTTATSSPAYSVSLSKSGAGGSSSGSSGAESIYEQTQAFRSERQADLEQLGTALSSGDLKSATQDYQNLVQLGEQGPFASGQPFARSDRASDFQTVGQALQSGNLATAQQAFTTLENTFNSSGSAGLETGPPATNGINPAIQSQSPVQSQIQGVSLNVQG